jgi:condensin-2 complex subunit H2
MTDDGAGPSQPAVGARAAAAGAAAANGAPPHPHPQANLADLDAELRENRFAYLLQPIRDLASNWDVDIAAELEEYLEELEALTFTIKGAAGAAGADGGAAGAAAAAAQAARAAAAASAPDASAPSESRLPLNFAEAALLIQGTTCVYSKKVEYLYNLVYQALETIHCKRQREKAAAAAAAARAANGGGDGSDDGEDGEDGDEDFLNMGEGMEQADDIDLDDDGGVGSEY